MNKNYERIILLFGICLLLASPAMASFENTEDLKLEVPISSTDSIKTTEKDTVKSKKPDPDYLARLQQMAAVRNGLGFQTTDPVKSLVPIPVGTHGDNPNVTTAVAEKTFRSFPKLDRQLLENNKFNVSFADRKPEFTDAYIAANFKKNPAADKLINQAKGALTAVKKLGNFVDIITGKDLLELPVGLKKTDQTSGNSVELAISEVVFTPGYAQFNAWARMTIPEKGEFENEEDRGTERELFFGAQNVKLTHDGGLSGDMKLVLLGDVAIPMNGDNWLITLKGGIDLKTGEFGDASFIEFSCSDFKAISLEGDVRVSRNVLIPITSGGNYVCGDSPDNKYLKDSDAVNNKCYVGASFEVKAEGWNDLLVDVSLPKFEVRGLRGWGFNLKQVVLDLSDTRNASGIKFPKDYSEVLTRGQRELWRGFYAKEISVMLPEGIENTKKSNGRVEFGAKDLILDSQGVSGTFFAENVLQTGNGAAGKWAFTIEDVSISLSRNSLTGGSIGGDIAVPIFEEPMDYAGYIHQNGYGLEVGLQSDYKTPVFLGEMQLERNSSVAIHVKDGNVYPYANLSGKLAIAGKINQKEGENPDPEDKNGFAFNGISFQELELQTEPGKKPIQAKSFGYEGEMKLMNFPASISDLQLVTPNNQMGLSFDLKINLDNGGSHASTKLQVLGELKDDEKIQDWKFKSVKVEGIDINYTKSDLTIVGGLEVMEDDPIYGNGFKGNLKATFNSLNFSATGKAIFGKTDFRYWNVDIWTDRTDNTGKSKLPIKAFVGGVSNRMKKVSGNGNSFDPGNSKYEPDSELALSVRAGVEISTGNAGTFNAKAYLELVYNKYGGLNRIGFTGEGAFMSDEKGYDSPGEKMAGLSKVADDVLKFAEKNKGVIEKLAKAGNFLGVAQQSIPVHEIAASGGIGVYVGIEKNFVEGTFDGEFELYIDLEGIKGGGENNLAGYAKIHTGPDDWYLWIGTPQQRIELLFNFTPIQLRIGGYFMTGTKLPDQLDPHPIVVKILGNDMINGDRKENQLSAGKGFAFGLNFGYGYGFDWKLFYAFVEIGAGFDVMHAYYPDAKCKGRTGPVGNNGWYSMGQVYAYLYGEFGVKVDLAFIKGKFVIAEAGVAAMLRGQFPNPIYIQGYVGMYYKILGGLVSGRMRMKVELGEECQLENIGNTVGVPIISDLTPGDNKDDVSVFTAPQAVFNYAANTEFTVDIDEGVKTFKLQLREFTATSDGTEIEGDLEWNETNDAVTFNPKKILPSEKNIKVLVEVGFEERIGGSFQLMMANGKPVTERKEITFKTDKAPDHIVWDNVAYVYPVKEQNNFYPEEYNTGYIKMIQFQDNLFANDFEMRAEFISAATGQGIRTNVSYDQGKSMVFFEVPELVLNSEYDLNLMVFPPGQDIPTEIVIEQTELITDEEVGDTNWYDQASDSQSINNTSSSVVISNKKAANVTISKGAPKSIFDYPFKTSQHASFGEKLRDINVVSNITNYLYADVHSLSIKVDNYEYLEKFEVTGGRYTGSEPLVYAQAILNDNYYKNEIHPLIYENYPLDGAIELPRDTTILGAPPIRSFYVGKEYTDNLLDNPNSHWVKNRIPFVYNLPYQYKTDFVDLRNRITSKYSSSEGDQVLYDAYKYIIDSSFPPLPLGRSRGYNAQLIYRTPGALFSKGYKIKYNND